MKARAKAGLERVRDLLLGFRFKTAAGELGPRLLEASGEEAVAVVGEVLEMEARERNDRRVERLRKASHLPAGKHFDSFDTKRLPRGLSHKLSELGEGKWVEEATNVLMFGLPGVGKSHVACALGHALVERGYAVRFTPTFRLVQELLAAKRELELPRALRRLDLFDLLILD